MRNSYLFIYFTGTLFFYQYFLLFFVTVFVMCIGALEILYVLYYIQINNVIARLLWLVLKLLAMFSQWKDKVLIQPLKLQWQIPITLSLCLSPPSRWVCCCSLSVAAGHPWAQTQTGNSIKDSVCLWKPLADPLIVLITLKVESWE